METKPISTGKTLGHMLAYFGLFLAGELLSSLPFDLLFSVVHLPYAALYTICRMAGSLAMTVYLFWLYTTKVLHRPMADFRICLRLPKWSIALAILLPGFVVAAYSFFGQWSVGHFTLTEGVLLALASVLIALKSGSYGRDALPGLHHGSAGKPLGEKGGHHPAVAAVWTGAPDLHD